MFEIDIKIFDFMKSNERLMLRHFHDLKLLIDLEWIAFERIYNDGYTCSISSNADVYKSHFENSVNFIHSPDPESIRNNIFKNISLLEKCDVFRVINEMQIFNCNSHFLLIYYHKEYQDVFRVSLRNFTTIVNHLQLIEHTTFKFIARYRQLIESDCAYFMLPKAMQGDVKTRNFTRNIILSDNLKRSTQITAREYYVLRLYVKGKPHKQIGEILGVAAATSEKYLENIKNKLNITSRKELKALACDNWLI